MMLSAYIGDRRAHLRFQVMGALSSSLVSTEALTVLNVGISGALVESAVPLQLHAEYRMQLVLPGLVGDATVKVRRVTPAGVRGAAARYEVGLEFMTLSPEAEETIAGLVAAAC